MRGGTTAGDRSEASIHDQGSSGSLVLLVAALLLTVPLAGCAGGGGPGGDGGGGSGAPAEGDPFKAQAQRSTAEDVAEEWSSDATLIGVSTREMDEQPENWTEDGFAFTPDGNIGDGLSPQWLYFFQIPEGDTLGVGVNADGDTFRDDGAEPQTQGNAIDSWSVDSAAAVDAAKGNETFSSILEAEDAQVLYFLFGPRQEGGAANWALKASSESMGEEQTVLVNAETGELQTLG